MARARRERLRARRLACGWQRVRVVSRPRRYPFSCDRDSVRLGGSARHELPQQTGDEPRSIPPKRRNSSQIANFYGRPLT
jgi:hypothetical protein